MAENMPPYQNKKLSCHLETMHFFVAKLLSVVVMTYIRDAPIGMHDEIFHFEIFKSFVQILKYCKTPSSKYFMKFLISL